MGWVCVWRELMIDTLVLFVEYTGDSTASNSLPLAYQLLANIQLARARKAPKIILENARELPSFTPDLPFSFS